MYICICVWCMLFYFSIPISYIYIAIILIYLEQLFFPFISVCNRRKAHVKFEKWTRSIRMRRKPEFRQRHAALRLLWLSVAFVQYSILMLLLFLLIFEFETKCEWNWNERKTAHDNQTNTHGAPFEVVSASTKHWYE